LSGNRSFPSRACRLDFQELSFTLRNAPLLRAVPKFHGVVSVGSGNLLLELEDVTYMYDRPSIMDVKIGMRTWYDDADPAYIQKCKEKDAQTTQSLLGFRICGMQVYHNNSQRYWRASKEWCKTLNEVSVDSALGTFVHNESGLRPVDVYGGKGGVIHQLELLEEWMMHQTEFVFFSSSLLIVYEGKNCDSGASVSVRLVDFAHAFYNRCEDMNSDDIHPRDENFLEGLRNFKKSLIQICNL